MGQRVTTRTAVGLMVAAATTLAVVLPARAATPAGARRPPRAFIRTVEPFYPGVAPSTPPSVLPTVACVRPAGRQHLEAVFGYVNLASLSATTDIADGRNVILRLSRRATTVEEHGPQVTQFIPGTHHHEFAVRFRIGEVPAWRVQVPSFDDPMLDPTWLVTVRPTFLRWCGRAVPRHFSVVQSVPIQFGPTAVEHDLAGNVTAYSYANLFDGVVTACSAGGTPVPPDVVVGWNVADENLAPLDPGQVIVTVQRGDATYQLSRARARAAIDITQLTQVYRPSNDVTGRCRFPDGSRHGSTVKSTPYWADSGAVNRLAVVEVEGVLVIVPSADLPGGIRIR